MKSTIYLPKRINVGFNTRDDTYTGKLAYIIYYDDKNVLRKETSWQSWRDKKIPNEEFDNVPTSGFVLNKKAGGYSTGWNHRQTYTRVYDPRGFEFEITVPNLLYVLENATSTKGKGLEGEFVYGWDGKDLVLVPCESPDYNELVEYNDKLQNRTTIKGKDLIIGATYLSKQNENLIYIGRYDYHDRWRKSDPINKYYYFAKRDINGEVSFTEIRTLSKIIEVISTDCVPDYADIFSKFEYYEYYNPYDSTKDKYFDHTLESFTKYVENKLDIERNNKYYRRNYVRATYISNNGEKVVDTSRDWYSQTHIPEICYYGKEKGVQYNTFESIKYNTWLNTTNRDKLTTEYITLEEAFNRMKPQYKKEYLKDGKLRRVLYYE